MVVNGHRVWKRPAEFTKYRMIDSIKSPGVIFFEKFDNLDPPTNKVYVKIFWDNLDKQDYRQITDLPPPSPNNSSNQFGSR